MAEMLLDAEAYTYPQRHRPKDPHKDLCGQTHLHSQRLTQMCERSVQSHVHMQKHRAFTEMQTCAQRHTDRTRTESQRDGYRSLSRCMQKHTYRFPCMEFYTDV